MSIKKLNKKSILAIAIFVLTIAAAIFWQTLFFQTAKTRIIIDARVNLVNKFNLSCMPEYSLAPLGECSIKTGIKNIVINKIKSIFSDPLPKIAINLTEQNLASLTKMKENAKKNKIISSQEKKWHKAEISNNNQPHKVKIRLKGVQPDHIKGSKISLRVKSKDPIINNMREFNIQNPMTRSQWLEIFFLEVMRKNNVLAPRSFYANTTINNDKIGIMYVEESFNKELLESQNRQNSVMLYYNDKNFVNHKKSRKQNNKLLDEFEDPNLPHYFYKIYNTNFGVFNEKSIMQNPILNNHRKTAISLLRGYQQGTLEPRQVFDYDITANFFAVHQLLNISNEQFGLDWSELRFYYNPATNKIEPIAYDSHLTSYDKIYKQHFSKISNSNNNIGYEEWYNKLFADPKFISQFKQSVISISKAILRTNQYDEIYDKINNHYQPILTAEFPHAQKLDIQKFKNKVKFINQHFKNSQQQTSFLKEKSPIIPTENRKKLFFISTLPEIIQSYQVENNQLEILNAIDQKVTITAIYAKNKQQQQNLKLNGNSLPIILEAVPLSQRPEPIFIDFKKINLSNHEIIVEAKLDQITKTYQHKTILNYTKPAK